METFDLELIKSLASGYTLEKTEESMDVQQARSMIAHALQGVESSDEKAHLIEFIRSGRGDLKALISRIQAFVLEGGPKKMGCES